MSEAKTPPTTSPWHEGERSMHRRLGIAERMEEFGPRFIRDFLPEQHRAFYAQLPFLVVGAVDAGGAPWATVVEGAPGFASSPDPNRLRIDALPNPADPVYAAIEPGSALGLLGIELPTRRRNRIAGFVTARQGSGFTVGVVQAFGNCPQYIQNRAVSSSESAAPAPSGSAEQSEGLDDEARAAIAAADTFFVASYVENGPGGRSVDVSHRGGKPGFVRIDGNVLTIPDFAGNLHFNTLGNLLLNPRAGLAFVDFVGGDLLQVTGTTEVVLDGDEVASFQGAERLWRVTVTRMVRLRGALTLRGTFADYSPNTLMTGSWEAAATSRRAMQLRDSWRPFRVARIVDESESIRSFHLEPEDGAGIPPFQAGQYLPVRVRRSDDEAPLVRSYSLSVAPSDGMLRISVKRDGIVSQYLHDHVSVGDRIETRTSDGAFTIDAAEPRPVVLISAGVGITPMLAMLRHLVSEGLRTRRLRPTFFVHGSRTKADRAFDAEIAALAEQGRDEITVVRALSRPEASAAEGDDYDHHGRIDVALLKAVLPLDDYDFYLCGPAAFTQELYDGLRALRIPDERVKAEAFGPSTLLRRPDPGQADAQPALPAAAVQPVPVIFSRSAKEARWTPGSGTLLDLAEARGLAPEFSCRAGTCGTCRTALLEGEVTYASRPTATPRDGSALICCALPAGPGSTRIVLDL